MKSSSKASIAAILKQYDSGQDSLISLMQDIQSAFGYLPKEALQQAGRELDIPLSKFFAVASFYNSFNLEPQGKHTISVCEGTACHVKNADNLAQMVARELELNGDEGTSTDRQFTLKKVRCLGCCSMAPVVKVNDDIHGSMTQTKTATILNQYRKDKK